MAQAWPTIAYLFTDYLFMIDIRVYYTKRVPDLEIFYFSKYFVDAENFIKNDIVATMNKEMAHFYDTVYDIAFVYLNPLEWLQQVFSWFT